MSAREDVPETFRGPSKIFHHRSHYSRETMAAANAAHDALDAAMLEQAYATTELADRKKQLEDQKIAEEQRRSA